MCRNSALESWPTLGQRACLVHNQRVHFAQVFNRSSIAEQDAVGRTFAGGNHDGHWRSQAQRTRACNDQHGDGVDKSEHPTRLRAEEAPGEEGQQRNENHRDDEVARYGVGHALHRRSGALRLSHHLHNLRQDGCRTHMFGSHHQRTAGVHRRTNQLVTGSLCHRQRLASEH